MNKRILQRAALMLILCAAALGGTAVWLFSPAPPVRGKSSAAPLTHTATAEQQLAQDLALDDDRVAAYTMGRRAEVFGARHMMGHFTPDSPACETAVCYQVEIYDFDNNATITVIVDVDAAQVRDVLYLANAQPGVNKRLADLAAALASQHPGVIEALGYRPPAANIAAPLAGMDEGNCDGRHLCVGLVYPLPDGLLTVIVDLTLEEVAGIFPAQMPPDPPQTEAPFVPENCPAPGTVERDGWSLAYQTTSWDGLRVHTVSYNGMPVANNIKLVEWHVHYSSGSGFIDIAGCSSGGGGFLSPPYGETQVLDLFDDEGDLIGFEVVQDFRMSNWGSGCNYRYEQRLHFYQDGRFRVVSGAFGKGCQPIGVYRPVVRIDVAVDGSGNNSFATWDGAEWQTHQEEFWQLQDGPYSDEGYRWLVYNQSGAAFYIEPGQGQFSGSLKPDNAYIYVTMHRPEEGDNDLPAIGSCCNADHRQGPHNFVNSDPIANQNIVIWYVPQMEKYGVAPGPYSCWTVAGEPNPETYPCFSGPMFVPANLPGAPDYGLVLTATVTAQTAAPGQAVAYNLTITNTAAVTDTFAINLSQNEWPAIAPLTLTLAPEATSDLAITVTVPLTAVNQASDSLTVTATSLNDEEAQAAVTLTTTAIIYGAELFPLTAAQTAAPGSVVVYSLALINTAAVTDTFAITLSQNEWLTTAPLTLTLAPEAATSFVITVTIPLTAVHQASDSVIVTAISRGNEEAQTAVTLTTTAVSAGAGERLHWLYLPAVIRP
jgi:hypothetical protein